MSRTVQEDILTNDLSVKQEQDDLEDYVDSGVDSDVADCHSEGYLADESEWDDMDVEEGSFLRYYGEHATVGWDDSELDGINGLQY